MIETGAYGGRMASYLHLYRAANPCDAGFRQVPSSGSGESPLPGVRCGLPTTPPPNRIRKVTTSTELSIEPLPQTSQTSAAKSQAGSPRTTCRKL
jgi:hypothetical protein